MDADRHHTPKHSRSQRDLLSLIGLLNYAAKVVRPGRAFLRSLIEAFTSVQNLDHRVHLNAGARADFAWWAIFVRVWNGVSSFPAPTPSNFIISDALGGWGCAAIFNNLWLHFQWPSSWLDISIAPKELAPIVMAMALWGPQWTNTQVCALCDNMAVVAAVNKKVARDPALSRLLRILCMPCAIYNVSLIAHNLPGVQNSCAVQK